MVRRILNKHGMCKGGCAALVYDVDWIWPRAYVHRKKFWEIPAGFTMDVARNYILSIKWIIYGLKGDIL